MRDVRCRRAGQFPPASRVGGGGAPPWQTDVALAAGPLQVRPLPQAAAPPPLQHGWPMPPQAAHTFITQRFCATHWVLPVQQGWPRAPQLAQVPGAFIMRPTQPIICAP
jgi:hypothetical protein